MKTDRDGKKRKRDRASDKVKEDRLHEDKKKKKKKQKKTERSKVNSGGNVDIDSSSSLMGSIFGTDTKSDQSAGKTKSSSLLSFIFDNDGSNPGAAEKSSSITGLFDNKKFSANPPRQFPQNTSAPVTAMKATTRSVETKINDNEDPDSIRSVLKNRRVRSEHRPLLEKALDFPGVFSNEEIDGEVGFFRVDDDNERAKETADAVRHHGLCVIRDVIENTEDDEGKHPLRDFVLPAAKALQLKLNKALKGRKIHHSTETFRFREAASRCKGRTDVVFDKLEKDDSSMLEIGQEILRNPKLYPVIQNLLGGSSGNDDTNEDVKLVYAGLIFSYPGSCDQPWHQDGTPLFPELPRDQSAMLQASLPPYALNVFLPLEDDDGSIEKGPTEFIPNSHKWESPDERLQMVNDIEEDEEDIESDDDSDASDDESKKRDEAIIAPVLKRGDALIYDYRVCHRGTANLFGKLQASDGTSSKKKPKKKKSTNRQDDDSDGVTGTRRILYLMYARPWFTDHVNFDYTKSAESLFDGMKK